MDGDVNMDINLDYEEYQSILDMLDLKLPVKMTLSTDAGRESAHVITDAEVIVSERKFRCNHLNYTWI